MSITLLPFLPPALQLLLLLVLQQLLVLILRVALSF